MMSIDKNGGKNVKDTVVKIVLVIVIILLLIHNCMLLTKKKNGKTPSGNVNIIEITCEDDSKCDITDKKDSISNSKDDGNTSSNINSDDNDINIVNDNSSGSTGNGGTNNTKNNNSSSGNSSSSNSNETSGDSITEPDDEVFVKDKKLVWNDSSDLNIFTNSVYKVEGKIAPESSNTYQFVVKNSTSYKVKYKISFSEVNPYSINMKYKLKKNNVYVVDHYVSFNELDISNQLLNAKNNDTFYLDWKWVSSDNDTVAGKNGANYSLTIDVGAESVDG